MDATGADCAPLDHQCIRNYLLNEAVALSGMESKEYGLYADVRGALRRLGHPMLTCVFAHR